MDKIYGDDYNKNFDTYAKGSAAVTIGGMIIGTISKGIAKNNQKKAEEIYHSAQDNYMASYRTFEENSEKTKKTIINVVNLKKHIMCVYIKEFLRAYQRLAPQFILQESQGIRELQGFTIKPEEAKIIRRKLFNRQKFFPFKILCLLDRYYSWKN